MAKKVLLRDWNNDEVLPITRGELVLDSSGKEAFRSNEFLATTSQPGLMSSEDKFKIDNIEGIGNIANDKVSQVNTTTSDVYRLLFSETADDETRTEGARKSAKLTFNPSTGVLQTSGLIGNIDGTYVNKLTGYSKATLISDITSEDTLVSALGKVELRAEVAYNLIQGAYDGDGTIENLAEILKVLEGISDTETIQAIIGKYLPLTGGTITGNGTYPLEIKSGSTTYSAIRFTTADSNHITFGYKKNLGLFVTNESNWNVENRLIHTGNYADTTDKRYLQLSGGTIDHQNYGDFELKRNQNDYDSVIKFSNINEGLLGYIGIGGSTTVSAPKMPYYSPDGSNVYPIIHSNNIGGYNAGSASKLNDNTAYTAWGQTFFENGVPKSVSGNLHLNVHSLYWHSDSKNYCIYSYYDGSSTYLNIKDYGNILFHTSATERMRIINNGNVLIGTTEDNGNKLQVSGNISSTNLWPIITISKSLTITSDWTDTGITFSATNFPHGNGSYMVQIDHGNCYFYTGVISVVINDGAVTANDVDEIILHGGGFDSAIQYYLRTKQDASSKTTKIQIATSGSSHTKTVNFKFKRII